MSRRSPHRLCRIALIHEHKPSDQHVKRIIDKLHLTKVPKDELDVSCP